MKRKIVFMLALSAIILFGYPLHATSPTMVPIQQEFHDTPPGENIILLGSLLYNIDPNAIKASVTDDFVYIQFNQSFGSVTISLYNSIGGLLYGNTVNTDVQYQVVIPIGTYESGSYILEINSINGGAEGGFEHNND